MIAERGRPRGSSPRQRRHSEGGAARALA